MAPKKNPTDKPKRKCIKRAPKSPNNPLPQLSSSYTPEVANVICELIADGQSLRRICRERANGKDFPSRDTVLRWLMAEPDFAAKYAHAREIQGDESFDRVGDTIDDLKAGEIVPDVARVILDGLKWRAAKLLPKKYGDKLDLNHEGGLTVNIRKLGK